MSNDVLNAAEWQAALGGCILYGQPSSLLLSSLELSDTNVYEPQIRALLGTASHFNPNPLHPSIGGLRGFRWLEISSVT